MSEQFDARHKVFVDRVSSGQLQLSYDGIFVDEVQQMKEEWLYALLNCTNDDKYMIVSGDYYQCTNDAVVDEDNDEDDFLEEGEEEDFRIGGYDFETIVLDKNYRNTKEIATVLNNMLVRMKNITKELELSKTASKKDTALGYAYRKNSIAPRLIRAKGEAEVKKVADLVKDLINNQGYNPNDILVIIPQADNKNYYLSRELAEYGICNFAERGSIQQDRLMNSGVRLGTSRRSIGLDFKAVILYGTNLFGAKDRGKIYYDNMEILNYENMLYKVQNNGKYGIMLKDEFTIYTKGNRHAKR